MGSGREYAHRACGFFGEINNVTILLLGSLMLAGGGPPHLHGEAKAKSIEVRTIDFDEVKIPCLPRRRKGAPFPRIRYGEPADFITIRHRWHPEMLESAAQIRSE